MISKTTSSVLLFGAALLLGVIGFLLLPIPQPQSYHHFADERSTPYLTNIWNVLSNIPFAFAGIWGLFLLFTPKKLHFIDSQERWFWTVVSLALILTAIGSAYYHLAPDNHRLVWDRIPITIVFMSFISALIYDRVSPFYGWKIWPLFIGIGIFSVLYWYGTEQSGKGDLRFYLAVQGFTFLTTLIMIATPSHYTRSSDLVVIALFYGLAIIFEHYDRQIYTMTGGSISGHTLKHLSAALAGFWMILMIRNRKIV